VRGPKTLKWPGKPKLTGGDGLRIQRRPWATTALTVPLDTHRKAIERGQRLGEQLDVIQIDELLQIGDLVVAFGFVDIDIPGFLNGWTRIVTQI
jgi:hypothetical protein